MTAPDEALSPTGLLLVDKPYRLSSMSVCRVVRARLVNGGAPKRVKVGHGGTLDPLASGLLVILIGKATRLCETIMAGEKEYEAEIDLSRSSTTDDLEGVLTPVACDPPSHAQVAEALGAWTGQVLQRPPAHSAMKVPGTGGQRSYKLARKAERAGMPQNAPILAPREVFIRSIAIRRFEFPLLSIHVVCGKGVYIRSLARDLGEALTGNGGTLTMLRRTRISNFRVSDAMLLNEVPDPLRGSQLLLPADLPSFGR